jgi:ABC-2 type transport system permease protein
VSSLLTVEIRRLLSRRVVRILFLLCIVGIVIAGVSVFVKSSDEPRAAILESDASIREEVERCRRGELGPIIPPGETQPTTTPTVEQCLDFLGVTDPSFNLVDLDEIVGGTSVPLIILAWVIGATSVGAEWQKGTLQTMLTWEPRRLRLIGAKLAACAVVVALGFLFLEALLSLALWPAAAFRGSTVGADEQWLVGVVGVVSRGAAVAVFGASVGFAIATVGRNTAAALGVGFLYISVIEGLVRGLRPQLIPWLVADNAAVFITAQPETLGIVGRSTAEAGLLLCAYALVLCAAAAALFRARDVT